MNVFTVFGKNSKYFTMWLLYATKWSGNTANSCTDSKMGRKHAVVLFQLDFDIQTIHVFPSKLVFFDCKFKMHQMKIRSVLQNTSFRLRMPEKLK